MEGHCLLIAINQDPQIDWHPRHRTKRARWRLWVWYTSSPFDSLRHSNLSGLQVGVLLFYLPYLLYARLTAKLFLLYLLELRETGIWETTCKSSYPWNILKHRKLVPRSVSLPGQNHTVPHQQADPMQCLRFALVSPLSTTLPRNSEPICSFFLHPFNDSKMHIWPLSILQA